MRRVTIILLLTALSNLLIGQGVDNLVFHSDYERTNFNQFVKGKNGQLLDLQLMVDENVSSTMANEYHAKFESLVTEAKEKLGKANSDQKYLSWLFYRVHRKVLKNYEQYSPLTQVFDTGDYDCLSATTLYALLLNELGFKTKVVETNYHIYLEVLSAEKRYLIESTDALNGFVYNQREIEERLAEYDDKNNASSVTEYAFNTKIHNAVDLNKLVGLQYYNRAVDTFNNGDILFTLDLLEKSTVFYHSERIVEFGIVLAQAIMNDKSLNDEIKSVSINRVGSFIRTKDIVASR
ncbi:hypothetical protein [Fulvivirga lutimaris]|uniref:hypothetical protein n=1 Tax=Fulvivirga lutimaris TaxID=1819566 RepID=UPI0012BBA6D4|nr:hypothetical protein [Fulvivirga lutimaris]MTI39669.1 hypothetical protein [Fulvivirga lutimaris]